MQKRGELVRAVEIDEGTCKEAFAEWMDAWEEDSVDD